MSGAPMPEVVVHPDRDTLVTAVVARLSDTLRQVLTIKDVAHLVVTGGGVGTAVLTGLRSADVDWRRVHLWWGDERFLAAGHADRNDTQARAVLLDHVAVDPAQVHPMPAADQVADLDAAAARYAELLLIHAGPGEGAAAVPPFDILLLGVGDDAHIASLFPGLPGAVVEDRSVVGVRDSPKPPPLRVSLTFPAIRAAHQVWLLAAGAEKAGAVARALAAGPPATVPAAGATGRDATVWLLDQAAAVDLPPDLAATPE